MNDTIELLRDEHRRLGIGPEIARLLERVVRATAPTYPAAEYGAAAGWTVEELEDLLHDWVAERLLGRGDLAIMLRTAGSSASLRAALTTSVSQFIINRRRRTSASNLYRRTAQALRSGDEFRPAARARRSAAELWTLDAAPATAPSMLPLGRLVQVANELTDEELPVIRYGPFSLKSSPILREPALRRFLRFMLERAEGALSLATIAEVMRRRFRLFELEDVALDTSTVAAELPVPRQVELVAAAESVVARMGEARAGALRAFEESGGDFAVAGAAIGGGAAEGEKALTEVVAMVADLAASIDDARAIYTAVIERLF